MIHFTVHRDRESCTVEIRDEFAGRMVTLPTGHEHPIDMIGEVYLTPSGMPEGVRLTPMGTGKKGRG